MREKRKERPGEEKVGAVKDTGGELGKSRGAKGKMMGENTDGHVDI